MIEKQKKILIVEDSSISALEVSESLKREGFIISGIAPSGLEAINIAQKEKPELILMDIMLDGKMSGIEAAREIGTFSDAPVIFTSALTDKGTLESAKTVNPYGYIIKPYDSISLNLSIELALKRYNLEKKIDANEKQFKQIYDNLIDALIIFDFEGTIKDVNEITLSVTGYSREELIGESIKILGEDKAITKAISNIISEGSYLFEGILKNRNQVQTQVSVNSVVVSREDGGLIQTFIRDITEIKELEERYRQSQKMEAVGRLAGGIAHDFNNLLTVISGYSQILLMQTKENDSSWQHAHEINEASKRASELTRQLLIFSRQKILQPHIVNVNEIISQMEKMLQRIIGETIVMETSLSDNLYNVTVDQGRFEQVLLNLVVNAKDAIGKSGTITIKTENYKKNDFDYSSVIEKTGSYVLITVEDDGCGMDQEVKTHVFEPFYTTKKEDGGTGLGLSMVYGIIKQSDGYIDIESTKGEGTKFKIYLTATDEAVEQHENIDIRLPDKGKGIILVVEDEISVREFVIESLEMQGYDAYGAENGLKAIEVYKGLKEPIDLILTDVIMPQLNGYELYREIKKLDENIKVMYMSGYTDEYLDNDEFKKEDVEFIQKPFEHKALIEKIQKFIN